MKIGFLGAGEVALAVAKNALNSGHQVALASRRGPDHLKAKITQLGKGASAVPIREAASQELVILAVPWLEVANALSDLPAWNDRILVDATNPFIQVTPKLILDDLRGESASVIVARHAPGARVIKAFNSVTMANFEKGPTQGSAKRVLFVSGDDPAAKETIRALIESFGYAAIDLGGLQSGGLIQQAGGPLAGKDFLVNQ